MSGKQPAGTESTELPASGPAPARPLRVLVLYYSQSGDVQRAVESFTKPLQGEDVELTFESIRPQKSFPYPWKNVYYFFSIFPECILGRPPAVERPGWPAGVNFDLVILGYQVWFLSPSLPVQGFLKSRYADVLKGTKVITLSVSRNMWHSAAETMKQLLAAAGAVHVDNAVIVHQGPVWATFITTTRMLFFGKKDRLWGIFPPAGIRDEDFDQLQRFGAAIAAAREQIQTPGDAPLLTGLNPAPINRRYVLPEFMGWYVFYIWARITNFLGGISRFLRPLGIIGFVLCLIICIIIGIPLMIIARILLYPFLKKPLADYVARLQQPSEFRNQPAPQVAGS